MVLDSLDGGTLGDIISGMVYLGSDVVVDAGKECVGGVDYDIFMRAEHLFRKNLDDNGVIQYSGLLHRWNLFWSGRLHRGFEDYDTWKETTSKDAVPNAADDIIPLLMIALP